MQNLDAAKRLKQAIASHQVLLPPEVTVTDWGTTASSLKLVSQILYDQRLSTLLSFMLVFLIVCFQFRSLTYGLASMIPIMVGVMCSYGMMYLFGIPSEPALMTPSTFWCGSGNIARPIPTSRSPSRCSTPF
jgi:predicted RND superfamily exporter protein